MSPCRLIFAYLLAIDLSLTLALDIGIGSTCLIALVITTAIVTTLDDVDDVVYVINGYDYSRGYD